MNWGHEPGESARRRSTSATARWPIPDQETFEALSRDAKQILEPKYVKFEA